MRSLRWLLLVVIALISAGVFQVYRVARQAQKAHQRAVPPPMALEDRSAALYWQWGQSTNGKPAVEAEAAEQHTSADGKTVHLKDVSLRIYEHDGKSYDRVHTDYADFDNDTHKLKTDSDAEITLDVPAEGEPKHQLTSIKAAGISYDSEAGKAETDKHTSFVFAGGDGVSGGATYDPATQDIHLMHGVVMNLKSHDPKGRPMKVETEDLVYNEKTDTVTLGPWSKLTRDQTAMQAGTTIVHLKTTVAPDGQHSTRIDNIEAPMAHGTDKTGKTDKQEGRNLEYSADLMRAYYNDHGEIERIEGTGNARLLSHAKTAETSMAATHLNLFFTATANDSVLNSAQGRGNASLESKPVQVGKEPLDDTKIIHSDSVDVFMKPDGKDLDHVATLAPGTMEFLPNQPTRSHRLVKADRMTARYGANNTIQSFHADAVSTETHPSQYEITRKDKPKSAKDVGVTSSRTMDVAFDDKGQVKQIQQAGNFRYSEGTRKAQADSAVMDNAKNVMELEAHARVADDTGTTDANHIRIDQNTNEFDARGNVATTHISTETANGKQSGQGSGMLDPGEAMQGKADHVISEHGGDQLHYIGNAQVWQGGSRIQADQVDIDRKKKQLTAAGHVFSQLQDSPKNGPDGKPGPAPPATLIRSQKMVYTDTDRLAVYTGDVTLTRQALTVKCATLQAYMNDGKPVNGKTPDSRIDRASADGKVEIAQSVPGRQRVGTSDHGEYYTGEGKIVLTGGRPYLKDSARGDTQGEKITWFANDDKLVLDGAPKQKIEGHIFHGKS
ncbi:MAG TPA: LptA/OstA family protein [Bryobacteraceae bacterium]|nr:LptA/OstA family protein [Bryobacteraceae bacterium]